MNLTIDYLLSELNEIANKASINEIRTATMFDLREVMRRIGLEYVAYVVEEEVNIINHVYKIPDRIVGIDDVGFEKGVYVGRQVKGGGIYDSRLAFTKDIRGLYFPNLATKKVWIRAYQLMLDDKNAPLIPEEAYQACYDYCKYKIVSVMPTSPYFPQQRIFKDDADVSIKVARGHFNETTSSFFRENRR